MPAQTPSLDAFHEQLLASSDARPTLRQLQVRRRANPTQGRALENLGHAVEYLMDSALFNPSPTDDRNQAALQLLMRASRAVFEDCAPVLPLRHRLGRWRDRLLARTQRPRRAC